jgi:hypothetical protein
MGLRKNRFLVGSFEAVDPQLLRTAVETKTETCGFWPEVFDEIVGLAFRKLSPEAARALF